MDTKQALIVHIVAGIAAQTALLDDERRRMFLKWLQAHHASVAPLSDGTLKEHLATWLEGLPEDGIFWEYQLILSEIIWWRTLNEASLSALMAAS